MIHAVYYDRDKTPAELQLLTTGQVLDLRQRSFITQLLGDLTHADASAGEYISARGLIAFDNRLMLIAAAPVVIGKAKAAAGLLLMGRYLDTDALYKIGHVTDLKVRIVTLAEGLQHGLSAANKIIITYPDPQILTAYLRLDDIEGQPVGALRAIGERWTGQGLHSQYYLLGSLLVAFLTLIGVVLWLLNHIILRRLTTYDRIIDNIRRTEDMRSLRVPLHGRDELDRLGATVNEMLDTLANSRQRLYHDAYHDVLTGLANRRLFIDRLNQIIQDSQNRRMRLGIVSLDLDGFKEINDAHGHDHGDELLRAVAKRLEHCVRQTDTISRFGGDEFVVLLYNVEEDQAVEWISRKIITTLAQPYHIQDKTLSISVSAGAALYPYNGGTAEKLLKAADVLMYHAKATGKNRFCLPDGVPHLANDGPIAT
jgi:diguanylate cyclase (GGDEF)-like protein